MDQGQLIILVTVIPPLVLGYFLLFLKSNRLNNLLTGLIFVSFLFLLRITIILDLDLIFIVIFIEQLEF